MRPDYHQAIIDTIQYYGWQSIIYLYDSHDGELLHIYTIPYHPIPFPFPANQFLILSQPHIIYPACLFAHLVALCFDFISFDFHLP